MLMPPVASMEDNLYVRINTSHTKEALAWIETAYKQFDKSNPVEFNFLDQNFAHQYAAEQKQETLCLIFTVLAVFIATLGLFGLAAFTAQQRVKEIGIRKVLGASVQSVVTMLSKDFIKLVGHRYPDRHPHCLAGHASMAPGLCLSYCHSLVDIRAGRYTGIGDHHCHHQYPRHQSGPGQPGGQPEKRITLKTRTYMLKNYLLVALRTLWKHKVFTAINIAGLAIGISASLVILPAGTI